MCAQLTHEINQLQVAHPTVEQVKDLEYRKAAIGETVQMNIVMPVNLHEAVEGTDCPRVVTQSANYLADVIVPEERS